MVLDYLRVPYQYGELLRLLQIGDYGTAFSNIRQLVKLGLHVEVRAGDMAAIRTHLRNGSPVIAFLNTGMLSYWTTETGHAVVVIGLDEQAVYVHDPYLANPAKAVPLVEFEAAWIDKINAMLSFARGRSLSGH